MNYYFSLFSSLQLWLKRNFRYDVTFFNAIPLSKKRNQYEKIFLPSRKKLSKLNRKKICVFCESIKCNINADYAFFYSRGGQYFLSLTTFFPASHWPFLILIASTAGNSCKIIVDVSMLLFFRRMSRALVNCTLCSCRYNLVWLKSISQYRFLFPPFISLSTIRSLLCIILYVTSDISFVLI